MGIEVGAATLVGSLLTGGAAVYSAVRGEQARKKQERALSDAAPSKEDLQATRKSSELPTQQDQKSQVSRLAAQKRKRLAAGGRSSTILGGGALGGTPSSGQGVTKTLLGQ